MDQSKIETTEMFRLMDRVRRAWLSVTPHETLNKSQFATLLMICRKSGQCGGNADAQGVPVMPSVLADDMHQSRPALSQRIHVLEEMGYVERVPDPTDRRVVGARLTEEGMRVLNRAEEQFNHILLRAMGQLCPEHAEMLISLLAELADALEVAVEQQTTGEGTEK